MNRVFLSIGSNLGDRLGYINKAIDELVKTGEIILKNVSSIYETEPIGVTEQPKFLNIVVEIETKIEPDKLLDLCKNIEVFLGRKKRDKWREREIDIDIIFFGDLIINEELLVIPHKELYNRKFVLLPLFEIAEDFICPLTKKSVKDLLGLCKDNSTVQIINN